MKKIRVLVTKNILVLCALLATFALNRSAFANGGVSDGGGGTTIGDPADKQWIVSTGGEFAGKMLLLWLNFAEANFHRLDASEQQKSPLYKLFHNDQDVFQIVRNAVIEMRMSGPCYDKNGAPWDGSIYASKPGAICISPFSMAPKLSEMNYEVETVALIMHELSHLMGTNEDEARAIQKQVIYGLSKVDFISSSVQLDLLSDQTTTGRIPFLLFELQSVGDMLQLSHTHMSDFTKLITELTNLRDDLSGLSLKTQMVRESMVDAFLPQYSREQVIERAIGVTDSSEDAEVKKDCSNWLDKAFAGQSTATAREIETRLVPGLQYGPEYDQVTVLLPQSSADIIFELKNLQVFLKQVMDELSIEKKAKIGIYLTN